MKQTKYMLLPEPRTIEPGSGTYQLPASALMMLDASAVSTQMISAKKLSAAIQQYFGLTWTMEASGFAPREQAAVRFRIAPDEVRMAQGYELTIAADGIQIIAHDAAGIFYGVQTLTQLFVRLEQPVLDCMTITDWPDFSARGVMLDISRDKVYSMDTLYDLIDRLSYWKINQVQLYTEHTFAYRNHPLVWKNASPMTGEEILLLDAYCRERFIELVPNQNSFGHMERWLPYPPYYDLAETHDEFEYPWGGTGKGPFSLAPVEPASLEFVRSLYDELLPHFTSRLFNVGCDETFDLGMGKSKEACERDGVGRVYLDFLLKIYQDVKRRGYTMMYWGDIICKHPELIPLLPKDAIALLWGYEADHPFDREGEQFAAAGVPFYVCPGTSAWNSLSGRADNAIANLINAAENGLRYGASGFLNTDWGDHGHWQVLPVSYLGFEVGAGVSWCLETNREMFIPAIMGRYAFEDANHRMGGLMLEFANLYQEGGNILGNQSIFNRLITAKDDYLLTFHGKDLTPFTNVLSKLDDFMVRLEESGMKRADAELIKREIRNTAAIYRLAINRLLYVVESDEVRKDEMRAEFLIEFEAFLKEYRAIWLARNRPGGLEDSVKKLMNVASSYEYETA
ncbi:MAG: family 20 glycosylhydrolase [Anaerolineaceae bacterium]|nr:family 20 glycosylhydrolase [Anaerolineaceae bacterium]